MIVFFNGATGGVGQYMIGECFERGVEAHPIKSRLEDPLGLLSELEATPRGGDPDVVWIQLAGISNVPACELHPSQARQINVLDTIQTVKTFSDWCRKENLNGAVVFLSSCLVYASQEWGQLLSESSPLAPRSAYAKTKLEAEERLMDLVADLGLHLIVARGFGVLGPDQQAPYLLPQLIMELQKNEVPELSIAGLDNVRDFVDARDLCRGLLELGLVALKERSPTQHIVNLCRGQATTLRQILRALLAKMQHSDPESVLAQLQTGETRPDDIPWIVGNPAKLLQILGHNPLRYTLDQTLEDAWKKLNSPKF
jgi:nucleoside-diphosphate-sugar epimerase